MKNTVAIMQPYVFPYIGYFCLTEASDVFVFYDDVHYIKGGWINRNRVLINGAPYLFTIPVSNGSPNELIHNVRIHSIIETLGDDLPKQIEQAYKRSPFLETGLRYVDDVLNSANSSISDVGDKSSVEIFYKLIGRSKTFLRSSERFSELRNIEELRGSLLSQKHWVRISMLMLLEEPACMISRILPRWALACFSEAKAYRV